MVLVRVDRVLCGTNAAAKKKIACRFLSSVLDLDRQLAVCRARVGAVLRADIEAGAAYRNVEPVFSCLWEDMSGDAVEVR